MKSKFGFVLAIAAASLWAGGVAMAQSSSGSSTQKSQSGQYGSSSSSSSSTSQRGGTQSDQYGGNSGSKTSRGQSGSSSGMSGTSSQYPNESSQTGAAKTHRARGDAAAELQNNPALEGKLSAMLPAGTTAQDAASGFKNVREFAETVHVSHDLNIPFDQLKTKVTSGQSLDQAVKELKPGVDAKTEVKKARDEARDDMKDTKSSNMKSSSKY